VDLIVLPYLWDQNGEYIHKLRAYGELGSWGLQKGFLLIGSANWGSWQNPVEQGVGETPLIVEEHLSLFSLSSENLEGLTGKVGTLGLQVTRKNHCGAAKKWARKAKLAEAPTGDSSSGQTRSALGGQPLTVQRRPNELW